MLGHTRYDAPNVIIAAWQVQHVMSRTTLGTATMETAGFRAIPRWMQAMHHTSSGVWYSVIPSVFVTPFLPFFLIPQYAPKACPRPGAGAVRRRTLRTVFDGIARAGDEYSVTSEGHVGIESRLSRVEQAAPDGSSFSAALDSSVATDASQHKIA